MPDSRSRGRVLMLCPAPIERNRRFGTEAVVLGLATRLAPAGYEVHLAVHENGRRVTAAPEVTDEGLPLHRLPALPEPTSAERFGMRLEVVPGFEELLEQLRPAIVQLFAVTNQSTNLRHVEIVRAQGCKTVLWHNVPGITCLQRGLLYENDARKPCDGEVRVRRCTYCRLRHAGLGRPAAHIASIMGLPTVPAPLPRRVGAVLRAREHTRRHALAVHQLIDGLDAIQVGAEWAREVLILNGAEPERIHLIRPGTEFDPSNGDINQPIFDPNDYTVRPDRPLRLIYWGRIHGSKSVDTVVEALARQPALNVEFTIVGNLPTDSDYGHKLAKAVDRDSRICTTGYVAPRDLPDTLRQADVAVFPSRWHETGPITVYEARALGLPIITTDRGGQAELCRSAPSDRLFPAEDASALAELLGTLADSPETVRQMRTQVPPTRTMEDVANEVSRLYCQLTEPSELAPRVGKPV